ncbi:hypothetical protein JM79_2163 [Gramella sp. Hel_I_59]|uniref:DUF4365 domain-containing protein n=1 Tax=Gramella sp. Hel_I_59 TaxID=1249978 RepID=UPI00114DD88F|nr:DUF4365 domain-containing protein [Gramella sp. Hel_I_59]TQI71236.1 hypothetical protein JM79_2163 [Gramella sp. Hel_I_59]
MIDNKPLEEQAENYIKSQLLKFNFNVLKPTYDQYGSDLILLENKGAKKTRFLNVQSKGRTLKNESTNVRIPKDYVNDNFVLFIYLITEKTKEENLFLFLKNDIDDWTLNSKNEYTLSISIQGIKNEYFIEKVFDSKQAEKLEKKLQQVEIKDYTTLLIDGVFLRNALIKTQNVYSEIWPDKEFIKPDLKTIVEQILIKYDRFKTDKKIVNCYVIESSYHPLKELVSFDCQTSFISKHNNQVNIFKNETDSFVSFEIVDQLERLINNDNIILVADDIIYESVLKGYKEMGVEIIMVLFGKQGRNMFVDFRWGDIIYPLGISIGLEHHEL